VAKTTTVAFDLLARDKASPVFDKFGRRVRDTAKSTNLLQRAGVGLLKTFAGYTAIRTATNFLRDANAEAREAQKVGKLTTNVIKTTGGAANVTAKHVADLANAISLKTGKDDEAIQSGSNLLLTFKKVRNEAGQGSKIFDRATKAAVDLSASGFGSITTTSKQLGKALQDPVKGITALGRAGVTFSESQKKQIKQMVEQNDLLGAQKIILKEVESQVKGSAAAQATAGDKARVAWQQAQEIIGTALLPAVDAFSNAFAKRAVPAAQRFSGWLTGEGIPAARDFYNAAKPIAADLLPLLGAGFNATTDALKTVAPLVRGITDAFNSLPGSAQKAVLLAGGLTVLSRRMSGGGRGGGLSGQLLAFGAGAATAGDRAGKASPKVTGLAKSFGKFGALAGGVFAIDHIADQFSQAKDSFRDFGPPAKNAAAILKDLQNSAVGKNAKLFDIDLSKLANDIYMYGEKGKYTQQVLKQVAGETSGLKAKAAGLEDLLTFNLSTENAYFEAAALANALKNIAGGAEGAGAGVRNFGNKVNLTANQIALGQSNLRKYRDQLVNLPSNVVTQITTPGAIRSKQQVIDLAGQYGLTPKEVKTIMKAMDFATSDIKKVMKWLKDLDNDTANPEITVETANAIARIKALKRAIRSVRGTSVPINAGVFGANKAEGGPIRGPGGPKDDRILIAASNNEHMLTAADVIAMGGHRNVAAFRKSLHNRPRRLANGGPTDGPPVMTSIAGAGKVELGPATIRALVEGFAGAVNGNTRSPGSAHLRARIGRN
jgi:hypothetical protein